MNLEITKLKESWITCPLQKLDSDLKVFKEFFIMKNSAEILTFQFCINTKVIFVNFFNFKTNKWSDNIPSFRIQCCKNIHSIKYNAQQNFLIIYYAEQITISNSILYGELDHNYKLRNIHKISHIFESFRCGIEFVNYQPSFKKKCIKPFEIHMIGSRTMYGELSHLILGYQVRSNKNKPNLFIKKKKNYFKPRNKDSSGLVYVPKKKIIISIGCNSVDYFCLISKQWFCTNLRIYSLFVSAVLHPFHDLVFMYQSNSEILVLDIHDPTKMTLIKLNIQVPVKSLNANVSIIMDHKLNIHEFKKLVYSFCNIFYNFKKTQYYIPLTIQNLIFSFANAVFFIIQQAMRISKMEITNITDKILKERIRLVNENNVLNV